jgi:uncharacterized low-complexity protein
MRIKRLTIAASVLALGVTMPALAKHPESQKTDTDSASSTCHAYRQAADGSWTEEPCQEEGGKATGHKPAAKGAEEEPR